MSDTSNSGYVESMGFLASWELGRMEAQEGLQTIVQLFLAWIVKN